MHIKIDYLGLLAYARSLGLTIADLTDEEKNWFIENSSMEEIYKIRAEEEVKWKHQKAKKIRARSDQLPLSGSCKRNIPFQFSF